MEEASLQIPFFAYFDRKNFFEFPQETYKEYVLFCLKDGSFRYKIGNNSWYTAQKNAIVLCPPETPFYKEVLEPVSLIMAKITCPSQILLPQEPVYAQDIHRVQEDIDCLTREGFAFSHCPRQEQQHYIRDLWFTALSAAQVQKTPLEDAYLYISSHYCEEISINKLAQSYGYTPPRFIALFNKHYGSPPKNIILKHRINKAQGLLLQTDLSVGEIALNCGYSDTLYFSRIFSKYCGCSPSQFRKQETI